MKYTTVYTVQGSGPFPLDMLRRDQSYPQDEDDALTAQHFDNGREVTLVHVDDMRFWVPLEARWLSFGWKLVALRTTDANGRSVR